MNPPLPVGRANLQIPTREAELRHRETHRDAIEAARAVGGRLLRVAAAICPPWVSHTTTTTSGIEVDAIGAYCEWRGHQMQLMRCTGAALPGLLVRGTADIGIGGLIESPLLRAVARTVRFARHGLCIGEPRHARVAAHVWAVSRRLGPEVFWIQWFLCRMRHGTPAARRI